MRSVLEAAAADQASGVPIAAIRMERARIVIDAVEFCRNVADFLCLREAVLSRNYCAGPIAIERPQLALIAQVAILRSIGFGLYEIKYDVPPTGVVNFAPDAFVVARYDAPRYELTEGSGGERFFQYDELPCPIRDRLRGIGFAAAVASVPRNMDYAQQTAPPSPGPNAQIRPTPEANRVALRRRNDKLGNPAIMEARMPGSALPDVHSGGGDGDPMRLLRRTTMAWRSDEAIYVLLAR